LAKDPAFLFFPEAFITGTMGMSSAEKGDYVILLCIQHQQGGLIPKPTFASMAGDSSFIRSKFIETEEGWFNVRLMEEIEKRQRTSTNMSENAKIRWAKYKEKKENATAMQLHSKCNATAMPSKDININKKLRSKLEIGNDKRGEFQERGESIRLTQLLFDLIKKRKLDFKTPDLNKWALEMDKIIRLDHREPESIEAVIRWSQADDFWQDNIISPAKLRKQFDQLELKMKKAEYMKLPKNTRSNIATYQQMAAEEGWDE